MSHETLSAVAGVLLSLAFSYVPGLSAWYETLSGVYKRLVMLACLLLVAIGAFGLSCSGWWAFVSCDRAGIVGLIEAFIMAAIANQSAHQLTPGNGGA